MRGRSDIYALKGRGSEVIHFGRILFFPDISVPLRLTQPSYCLVTL